MKWCYFLLISLWAFFIYIFLCYFLSRVAHYGELAPACATAYYNYGRALLYKAQEEADPLVNVPKKEMGSPGHSAQSATDGSVKIRENGECSSAAAVDDAKQGSDTCNNDEQQQVL